MIAAKSSISLFLAGSAAPLPLPSSLPPSRPPTLFPSPSPSPSPSLSFALSFSAFSMYARVVYPRACEYTFARVCVRREGWGRTRASVRALTKLAKYAPLGGARTEVAARPSRIHGHIVTTFLFRPHRTAPHRTAPHRTATSGFGCGKNGRQTRG
jgi:hypothetical protein